MEFRGVKGMNDILAPEIHFWRRAEETIRQHFECFGFTEIKTPLVEYTQLFTRSVGDTTDIVEKEMYTFSDRNEESLSLRPEGTASVVRAYLESPLRNQDPQQKFYYIGPMFRYERPQKGRYRQFYQYGIEFFGVESPTADAEMIFMLVKLYEKLGLKGLEVKLNSIGASETRAAYRTAIVSKLKSLPEATQSQLCEECQVRLKKNPMRILDCKKPQCQSLIQNLPSVLDFLNEEDKKHFEVVQNSLKEFKVKYSLEPRLVRGLDYYNRTVFEITSSGLGAQNAVGGGGRYDSLVEQFGGPKTPAVGYAGGFERLVLLMQEQGQAAAPALDLFVVTPDEQGFAKGLILANELRNEGFHVELDHTGKKMKNQMARAEKLGAQWALILGETELSSGQWTLKNMAARTQVQIPQEKLRDHLRKGSQK